VLYQFSCFFVQRSLYSVGSGIWSFDMSLVIPLKAAVPIVVVGKTTSVQTTGAVGSALPLHVYFGIWVGLERSVGVATMTARLSKSMLARQNDGPYEIFGRPV